MSSAEALSRALAVFRVLALGYAAASVSFQQDEYAHRRAGLLVLGGMAVWTAVAVAQRRLLAQWWFLALDFAIAAAALLSTSYVETAARIDAGVPTLPVSWVAAPVMAWGLRAGWPGGLAGGLGMAAVGIAQRGALTQSTVNGVVLLVLAGTMVGVVARLAARAETAAMRAAAVEASAAERERLSRRVHDGVLQVLALVQRGDDGDLARLAGEQERALRGLIAGRDGVTVTATGDVDLTAALRAVVPGAVELSAPAQPVVLEPRVVAELTAAVKEALRNVVRHAGESASAWVLVEDRSDAVVVSVRDNGVGMPEGRLQEALSERRFGVSGSIVGRVRDLGGTVTVESAPGQGTEVELRVPRR